MRFFQEVELPEFTTIAEVAYWIAFGACPTADYSYFDSLSNLDETREIVELVLKNHGHTIPIGMNFSESFLNSFFPSIDAKEYSRLYVDCAGQDPEQIRRTIDIWSKVIASPFSEEEEADYLQFASEQVSEGEQNLKASCLLREMQTPFIKMLRTAQAKFFIKLVDGEISAKGVKLPLDELATLNWEPDDWPSDFSAIDTDEWSLSGIDWNSSNLKSWKNNYLGIIVKTTEVLRLFPIPDMQPSNVSGEMYWGTFILSSNDKNLDNIGIFKRPRGAPSSENRILSQAIFRHLDALSGSKKLPDKKEA